MRTCAGRLLDWRAAVLLGSVAACLLIGAFHEPWADEAQAWLLARDQTWAELVGSIAYEGTPPGWHCLLKLLIMCGLPYECLFLVPCAAVGAGSWLLLYRTDAPRWVKVLLPLSYFVLYQGGVIARSYSLVYPLLMLVVVWWDTRDQHPGRMAAALVALALTCSQAMLVSGGLWLPWTAGLVKQRHARGIAWPAVVLVCYLAIVALVHTPADAITSASITSDLLGGLASMLSWVFGACVVSLGDVTLARVGGAVLIGFLAICYVRGSRPNGVRFAVMVLPLLAFLGLVVCKPWHLAVLFYAIAAGLLLFPPLTSDTEHETDGSGLRRVATVGAAGLLSLAVVATVCAGAYDVRERYAAGSDVATFIKDEGLEDECVCGLWYNAVDVEPYFSGALLANLGGRSGFLWSTDNGSWSTEQIEESNPAVVIMDHDVAGSWTDLTSWLDEQGYATHEFEAHTFFQFGVSGDSGYTVYVRE